jgi:hypothetical protein
VAAATQVEPRSLQEIREGIAAAASEHATRRQGEPA